MKRFESKWVFIAIVNWFISSKICIYKFPLNLQLLVPYQSLAQNKKNKKSLIIKVEDVKEFKKLLRTKTNLLVICVQSGEGSMTNLQVLKEAQT